MSNAGWQNKGRDLLSIKGMQWIPSGLYRNRMLMGDSSKGLGVLEVKPEERLSILAFAYQFGLHNDRYSLCGKKKESRLSVVRIGKCEYRGKGTAQQVSVTVGWDQTEKEFLYDLFVEDKVSKPNKVEKWDTAEFISKEGVLARLNAEGFAGSELSAAVCAFKGE